MSLVAPHHSESLASDNIKAKSNNFHNPVHYNKELTSLKLRSHESLFHHPLKGN